MNNKRNISAEKLKEILIKHQKWINCEEGGERANLRNADLRNADLSDANLSDADLRNADLSDANLSDADLWNANLRNANLRNANLRNATGNMDHIKSIFMETYAVVYTSDYLQIGCERHSIEEWQGFDDERISKMDGEQAIKFWKKYKQFIFRCIELSPCEPTGHDEVDNNE